MSDKTLIQVSKQTASRLFTLKGIGDSYDDVIIRLLNKEAE